MKNILIALQKPLFFQFPTMAYLSYIKALHIIFVVTWFAGLFYIVRLFIYHAEAEKKEALKRRILQEQYKIMSKRLWYIITWPSALLASFFAFWMLYTIPAYLTMPWMWIKLSFVFLLYGYHWSCQRLFSQLQKDCVKYSATQLRLWNEVATLLLFAIVFLVVLKDTVNWLWGLVGLLALGLILLGSTKLYKKIRRKKSWDNHENP